MAKNDKPKPPQKPRTLIEMLSEMRKVHDAAVAKRLKEQGAKKESKKG